MITVAIVGGSGYTGAELIRILHAHPQVRIGAVTSRAEAGKKIGQIYPSLSATGLSFCDPEALSWSQFDVVFFATPHGTAMHSMQAILNAGARVIDLSADFRLSDAAVFAKWYGTEHVAPELLPDAIYGLPELFPEGLAGAQLVACAGCYPTAVQLAMAPALAAGLVAAEDIIADCKSGVSGAGRAVKVASLYGECADSFSAYASSGHRHQPEIEQGLSRVSGSAVSVLFQPHLSPMLRGIHATAYLSPLQADVDWQTLYREYYADQPFILLREPGDHPATRDVRGGNACHLAVHERGGRLIVLSVIDNLVKGASGQAVQCLNLMQGWAADTGLAQVGLLP